MYRYKEHYLPGGMTSDHRIDIFAKENWGQWGFWYD